MDNLTQTINGRIEKIAASERITKTQLGFVSRELLEHYTAHNDGTLVTKLLAVLTPVNKKVAIEFFGHFLPIDAEGKAVGSDKMKEKKRGYVAAFLGDENNNIWTWADDNIDVEYKAKAFGENITKAVNAALKGHKNDHGETPPLNMEQIITALLASKLEPAALLAMLGRRAGDVVEEPVKLAA